MVFPNIALTHNNAGTLTGFTGQTGQMSITNATINNGSALQNFIAGSAGGAYQIAAPGFGIAAQGYGQFPQGGMPLHTGILWGPKRDLDYWTAREAGLVPEPERRAMKLFASECDEERFSLYCHLGTVAALGNMTKHLYIVRRYKTVVEVVDGKALGGWCVVTRDRHLIPETDHVLTLKSLVEGEEYSFRETGNRVGPDLSEGSIRDPYRRSFMPGEEPLKKKQVMGVCEEARERMSATKWRMWLKYKAMEKRFTMKIEPPKQVTPAEFELQELRNRLLMGVGAEPQTAHAF